VSGSASTGALTGTTIFSLTCTGPGGSATAGATVMNANALQVTPAVAALTLSQSAQFTASGDGGSPSNWSVDGVAGGNAAVGTISASGRYVAGTAPGQHVVTASSATGAPGTAIAAVTDLKGVYTKHYDLPRTGQNLQEYALTPTTVGSGHFGLLFTCALDGDVYAQPLYVANLSINGGIHNVVFVVTEHDSVYAIDADSYDNADGSCVQYWQISTLSGDATTVPAGDVSCDDINTEVGITGTPVIDPATQTMYFVAASSEDDGYHQRLHRISLTSGAEMDGSPVDINVSVGNTPFTPLINNQRPGLALANGNVYIAWSSWCDNDPYSGWVIGYDASTLNQSAVFDVTPNGPNGEAEGGIWMSGGAPAVDAAGNLYVSTANGSFTDYDGVLPVSPPNTDFSMSFLKLDPALNLLDFYSPSGEAAWSDEDLDISSGGVTVLPDGVGPAGSPNLVVGADKQAHFWVMDRTRMGGYDSVTDHTVQYLTLPNADNCADDGICVFATPAYYGANRTVYVGITNGPLMALPLQNGLFLTDSQNVAVASSQSSETYGYPSPTPTISASPAGNAILWALDDSGNGTTSHGDEPVAPAVLRAYDATDLTTTLYDSSFLPNDAAGNAIKFTVPVVANGHVYVGGSGQLTVYGLQ
jgi:hypothetical protein